MGKIIRDVTDRSTNPDLVRALRKLLRRAQAGELRSMIAITCAADNATGNVRALDSRSWLQPIIGEMAYVQTEITMELSLQREHGVLRDHLT
jgi:hypothetical protein